MQTLKNELWLQVNIQANQIKECFVHSDESYNAIGWIKSWR